jgi:predicted house-cleaning NTP pyrophosphatase (Maf/HAM1 superfamily)
MRVQSRLKRITIYIVGWGFIVFGILGIFLPILQGVLFILVGLSILSSVSPRAARLLDRIRRRFPRISNKFDQAKTRAKAVQARIAVRFDGAKSKARKAHLLRRKPGQQRIGGNGTVPATATCQNLTIPS